MTTTSKIFLGILGAAAAGVAIGLLVAPEKGSETRKRIRRTTGTWVDSLGDLFSKGKHNLSKTLSKTRSDGKLSAQPEMSY